MILYGFSIQGKSHIDKGTVCQDSNKTGQMVLEVHLIQT